MVSDEINSYVDMHSAELAKELERFFVHYTQFVQGPQDRYAFFYETIRKDCEEHPERLEAGVNYVHENCPILTEVETRVGIDLPGSVLHAMQICFEWFESKEKERLSDVQILSFKRYVASLEEKAGVNIEPKDLKEAVKAITKWGIEPCVNAYKDGWSGKDVTNGYVICYQDDGIIPGLEVERLDVMSVYESDKEAAEAAAKNGTPVMFGAAEWLGDKYSQEAVTYLVDNQENRIGFAKKVMEYEKSVSRHLMNEREVGHDSYFKVGMDSVAELINFQYRNEITGYSVLSDEKGNYVVDSENMRVPSAVYVNELAEHMIDNPNYDRMTPESKDNIIYVLDRYQVDPDKIEYLVNQSLYTYEEAFSKMAERGYYLNQEMTERNHMFCFMTKPDLEQITEKDDLLVFSSKHDLNVFTRDLVRERSRSFVEEYSHHTKSGER